MKKLILTILFLLVTSNTAADSCGLIGNKDLRQYCYGNCGLIDDADMRNFCFGNCGAIRDNDTRILCQNKKIYIR